MRAWVFVSIVFYAYKVDGTAAQFFFEIRPSEIRREIGQGVAVQKRNNVRRGLSLVN